MYIIKVPTGYIGIINGEQGKLEFLSIGDYGKEYNIKADFMGLSREINEVKSKDIIPLEEKWVITVSTQYGCSMNCSFCDVPKVGKGVNVSFNDLINQVYSAFKCFPKVFRSERLNIHFARMGEPTFNKNVLDFAIWLRDNLNDSFKIHPVVSTMMPKSNNYLESFLWKWMDIKNKIYNGNAGLQLSINSTNEIERNIMFNGNAHSLKDISEMFKYLKPEGRKITLNFALSDYEIDENKLVQLFNPENFLCKITPMHNTFKCQENGIKTKDGYDYYYPYKDTEERLKNVGYDVIVFIPSKDEDESRITCGNAILSQLKG